MVNVYSSCSYAHKRLLWSNLLKAKEIYADVEWMMGGDFNADSKVKERKGTSSSGRFSEMEGFSNFMENYDLIDVPCKGKIFSWYSGDGKACSRLDQFLISGDLINSSGIIGKFVGERDISDQSPV